MADKNRNGIPDHLENKKSQLAKGAGNSIWDMSGFGGGRTYAQTPYKSGILGQLFNFAADTSRNLSNFWDSEILGNQRPLGGGLGDYRFGSGPQAKTQPKLPPADRNVLNQGRIGNRRVQEPPLGNTDLPSFMSFLQQAMEQTGGVGRVSYDPLRQDARRRGSEYDARLNAMYNQLANSIRDDGTTIRENYRGAIDDTTARSATTQQQIQGASNVADDRNQQVLANLGIEQAAANQIAQGRDLNTQTADAVADAAARGQIAADRLTTGMESAATHNTNLAGAAGLEGNLQRARVQSELAALLAQYDMQEQEANRQAQQQALSQSMGLANALYEDAWRQRGYEDDVTRWLYEQQQGAMQPQRTDPMQYSLNFIGQLQQRFPDLDMETLLKMLGPAASIGKLAN